MILPHLRAELILTALERAAGKELKSGKFQSSQSSAALAANVFGYFLPESKSGEFPCVGCFSFLDSPVRRVDIERSLRLPWAGGTHPWLDAVIETDRFIVGIESKRYEPFRDCKEPEFSEAYDRPVWGERMKPYQRLMLQLKGGERRFLHLDAAQLVKHALGIRTQANKSRKTGALVYLYGEPRSIPDNRDVGAGEIFAHRAEITDFTSLVAGAEIHFASLSHLELLAIFETEGTPELCDHAAKVRAAFLVDQIAG